VFQMTSTVAARTTAGIPDILRALFPCASITGAPKVRTMEIIHELEREARGIYTGAMGYISPGREALFNVAIRTACVDYHSGQIEYGVGGGVVWDSVDTQEYDECRAKAAVLTSARPDFDILETMRWEPGSGYYLLQRHILRLRASAKYFGYTLDADAVEEQLMRRASDFGQAPRRVRLLLSRNGCVRIADRDAPPACATATWRVAFTAEPVNSQDVFLYHKTTNRGIYERARIPYAELDDVLLWNERGEVTESSVANVVVEKAGRYLTPPVTCGLLAGTLRAQLLADGVIEECVLTRDDVRDADRVFLINSVRKWIPAKLVD